MKIEDAAIQLCREGDRTHVWYGDPELCQDIYIKATGKHGGHPLNQIATVMSALAKSKKWRLSGFITHLGRKYPLRTPAQSRKERDL